MGVVAVVEETGFIEAREQLAPKQVKQYVEAGWRRPGRRVQQRQYPREKPIPAGPMPPEGMIEQQHHDSGKRIMSILGGHPKPASWGHLKTGQLKP
jgi:hypothetical protein